MTKEIIGTSDFQMATWAAMALYLPLSLMFWHAPALVHWHDVSPIKALFFSLVACIRNFGAMAVYFFSWLGVFVLGGSGADAGGHPHRLRICRVLHHATRRTY